MGTKTWFVEESFLYSSTRTINPPVSLYLWRCSKQSTASPSWIIHCRKCRRQHLKAGNRSKQKWRRLSMSWQKRTSSIGIHSGKFRWSSAVIAKGSALKAIKFILSLVTINSLMTSARLFNNHSSYIIESMCELGIASSHTNSILILNVTPWYQMLMKHIFYKKQILME